MNILVIEDEPSLRLGMTRSLGRAGHTVSAATDAADGERILNGGHFDLVITDIKLPDGNGMDLLKSIKSDFPETGVIMMTAFANVKTAVQAMRDGAFDYISKPFEAEELVILIEKFSSHRSLEQENIRLKQELRDVKQFRNIVGESPAVVNLCGTIKTVANTDTSVMICGETGTGKELVADAIYELSQRRDKPFIKINCAAIPDTLLESELFGYEKGAFTGATERRKGKFEAARGGTLFFDEIGDMPLSIQAKLLRVLEDMKVERLGGNELIDVDVRLIYATARDLKKEVESGTFRKDLFFRINVLPLSVPPLRSRKEDIPGLARYFLEIYCARMGKTGISIAPSAMQALLAYDYPGNVRELKHAIEMAVTLCTGADITGDLLPAEIAGREDPDLPIIPQDSLPLPERLNIIERQIIAQAVETAGGSKGAAAEKLGISRKTLWRKMRELGLQAGDESEG